MLSTFECLCICLSADGESFILLTIYRPGSTRAPSLFYDELSTVLESLVLQRCQVVVGGDLNIHVEDPTDIDAQWLAAVFDAFDMQQHFMEPTHRLGGTLNLVATFSDYDVTNLTVDHSLITCTLPS